MDEQEQQPPEYGLVMPFVTVTSNGGPHCDESYTAGYEMGALAALLNHVRPAQWEQPIHAANVDQADLIAMRFRYRTETAPPAVEGWRHMTFTWVDPAEQQRAPTVPIPREKLSDWARRVEGLKELLRVDPGGTVSDAVHGLACELALHACSK